MVPLSVANWLAGWESHIHIVNMHSVQSAQRGMGGGGDTTYESHDILRHQNKAHFYRYED
jgi:hypothetical protein